MENELNQVHQRFPNCGTRRPSRW